MQDYKTRDTVFSFFIPNKNLLPKFIDSLLDCEYIEDYEVVYSPILKENHSEIFRDDDEFLLNDPKINLVKIIKDIYTDDKQYKELSDKVIKIQKKRYPNTDDEFIYLNSILISVNFQVQALYNFNHKDRDRIIKMQEHYYGVTNEIELEKDENTANPIIDLYFACIDFRAGDINNNFKKNSTDIPLTEESIILDCYVKSDFLSLFEFVFEKIGQETEFKLIDIPAF